MRVRKIMSFCLLLAMVLTLLPTSVYASNPFHDVKDSDYFYAPVQWAAEQGITTGVSATNFAPADFCTRAQIVTFLWRAKGKPEPQGLQNPFTDVKPRDYFYNAVLWAVEQGITTGVSATSFAPEDFCTRAQAATFLYRSEGNSEVVELSSPFVDIKSGVYYYNPVLWAVKNEITKGTSSTTFSPEDTCTRAQIVTFLYRCYHNSADDYILKVNNSTLALEVGETKTLGYTYTGNKTLSWKSSNTSVATVSNGKVTAKGAGTAVITLTDGIKNSQCVVTVKEADYKLSLNSTSLTMTVGETKTLGYTYTGKGTLSWKSNNTSVATVSNGTVKAIAAGTATITLTDGNKSATCTVTVKAPTTPTGSIVIHTPRDTVVYVGDILQLDYTYTGDKSKLSFKSDDTSTLTITNSGLVTGVSEGSCYVFAYYNGEEIGYVRLSVKNRATAAKRIEVSNQTGPYLNGVSGVVGNYMTFYAFAPTADSRQTVTASSSNSGVATISLVSVDSSNWCYYKLSFKSAGSTTITITSEDGHASASYTVYVKGGYNCNPGKNQLTPEEFAYYATQVMVENGATATTTGGYRVVILSEAELTWSNARYYGENWVFTQWPNGSRSLGMVYQGMNEQGKHVFWSFS